MTKREFKELTGEDPVDFFGEDWKAIIEDWEGKEFKEMENVKAK